MKNEKDAGKLASLMVEIGKANGKRTVAVITDMNQPLGNAVGNSLEVIEAIETLKGNGPDDITKLSIKLAAVMIYAGGKAGSIEEGEVKAAEAIKNGAALAKLRDLIGAQGGCVNVIDDYSVMPSTSNHYNVYASSDGYIKSMDAMRIGVASQHTGAGRATKEDTIDLGAGIYLNKKTGDFVKKGDIIAQVHTDKDNYSDIIAEIEDAICITNDRNDSPELIKRIYT